MNLKTKTELNDALAKAKAAIFRDHSRKYISIAQELLTGEQPTPEILALTVEPEAILNVTAKIALFDIDRDIQAVKSATRAAIAELVRAYGLSTLAVHVGGHHVAILINGERVAMITGNFGDWL